MKKTDKPTLTPKLRFPGFRDKPGWEEEPLVQVADFISERIALSQLDLTSYVSTESILADFGGVTKANNLPTSGSATRYQANDVLIANIRPYLKKVWHADRSGGASNDVIVVRGKPKLLPKYFPFVLRNDCFIDYVMCGAKGVKMPRGDISLMKVFPVRYPSSAEQQKIADCLSSLDELIAAEGRKLEALRAHKKGLMQQLFPQPGQTRPRLRFPEFQDSGEWIKGSAGSIAEVLQGYGFPERLQGNSDGKYPFYKVSDISRAADTGERFIVDAKHYVDEEVVDELRAKPIPPGTTIFAKIGEAIRSNKRVITSMPSLIDNNAAGLKARTGKASDLFIYYLWTMVSLAEYSGGVVPSVNKSTIEAVPLVYPERAEQQRIAACLSSLDEVLAAQSRKVEGLKAHKKGLMQQLFPSPEEVEA